MLFFVGGIMIEKVKEMLRPKKWKLYLYYNGVLIKKLKIDENEAPAKTTYAIRVYFKKFLFQNIVSGIVVKPVVILKNDEIKRKTYWGVVLEKGEQV